jgi:hypothetical protein
MLTGLFDARTTVRDLAALPQAVDAASALAARNGSSPPVLSPALRETLEFGRKVWRLLEAAPALRLDRKAEPALLEELAHLAADSTNSGS